MVLPPIFSAIGNTPLFRLQKIAPDIPPEIEIWAKAEHLNPSGSVKDRAALAIVLHGIENKLFSEHKILLDATSGNTGIAYAMLGSALGYKVALCMPSNASQERKRILSAYGAQVIETDPLQSSDGAQRRAVELAMRHPELYYYPDQYNHPANWQAHYHGTAWEIWQQSKQHITHFVTGMGTSGTFMGTAKRLKELRPGIRVIAMQPDSPLHGLEGMKHMATTIKPGFYNPAIADDFIEIDTDLARATALGLARKEGLFVGISSGANVASAIKLAKTLQEPALIVTILCDSGSRYIREELWKEELYA